MILEFHNSFEKDYQKLGKKLQRQVQERLKLFLKNINDSQLHNHPLKGKYLDYRSINISGDYRAIFKMLEERCIFVRVDTHSSLYS